MQNNCLAYSLSCFFITFTAILHTILFVLVKSFGTEDRKAPNKVPARNEIYEYIVFRGSDIDDLHVAAGPKTTQGQVAEDPAIVQVCLIFALTGLSNHCAFPIPVSYFKAQ